MTATETETAAGSDPWADVVGQEAAVRQLVAAVRQPVHAYLLTGPPGAGARPLARGFAAELLAGASTGDDRRRHVRLALSEQHPDLRMVEPEGNTLRKGDAERLVRHAALAPVEGDRKVVVAVGCESIEDEAAGYLLKTIEEPPASTVFVLLASEVVPELVTIASRCVRIEVAPLTVATVTERLLAEGVDAERAEAAAVAAAGDLDRARTLVSDERLAVRAQAWRDVPRRLDGTGHGAATLAAELQSMIAEALDPLRERQAAEVAALEEQIETFGLRGAGKRDLETRHKREARRFRTDELRFGLATLAGVYRDALVARSSGGSGGSGASGASGGSGASGASGAAGASEPGGPAAAVGRPRADRALVEALERIDAAAYALIRYPNETLLLQALLAHLPPLRA